MGRAAAKDSKEWQPVKVFIVWGKQYAECMAAADYRRQRPRASLLA